MINKAIVYFLLSIMTSNEVTMGIEAEVRTLRSSIAISISNPAMKGERWSLFTDEKTSGTYEPEYATIGGLDFLQMLDTAQEIENNLNFLIKGIEKRARDMQETRLFKSFADMYKNPQDETSFCLNKNMSAIDNVFDAKNIVKDALLCLFNIFFYNEQFNNSVDIDKKVDKLLDNKIKLKIKESALNFGNKFTLLKEKMQADMPLGGDNDLNRDSENEENNDILIAAYKSIFADIIDETNKKENFPLKTNLISMIFNPDNLSLLRDDILRNAFDILTRYPSQGVLKLKQNIKGAEKPYNFYLLCPAELMAVDKRLYIKTCTPESIDLGFQLTYKAPISSITNLLKYYASYAPDITETQSISISSDSNVPRLLVVVSDCIINARHCEIEYTNATEYNDIFKSMWKRRRQFIIRKLDEYNAERTITRLTDGQAEGLFNLFLVYAMRLFNKSNDPEIIKLHNQSLSYGPKRFAPIMARVAFSEVYDKIDPSEQNLFEILIKTLCDVPDISIGPQEQNYCENLKLLDYNTLGLDIFRDVKEATPLTLRAWADSIIYKRKRITSQPKIVMKEITTNNEGKFILNSVDCDKMSPPPQYRRFINTIGNRFDNESINKLGNKAIYSMGAYTGVDPGDVVFELRPYSLIKVNAASLYSFVNTHGRTLFNILEQQGAIDSLTTKTNVGKGLAKEDYLLI